MLTDEAKKAHDSLEKMKNDVKDAMNPPVKLIDDNNQNKDDKKDEAPYILPNQYYLQHLDAIYQASGFGRFNTQLQTFMAKLDRHRMNMAITNRENVGVFFITRPKLNLTEPALLQSRKLAQLNSKKANSMAFAVRCLLDKKLAKSSEFVEKARKSQLFDIHNPFITPLCNALRSISGFPVKQMQTYTTTGGYHNEDQTIALGSDGLRRTYDLSLTFKDIQHSPVLSLFEVWFEWIELMRKGMVVMYGENIDRQRIPYSVGIYRFTLDPTKTYIQHMAKGTGCFPTEDPSGRIFDINDMGTYISAASEFSVNFKCNNFMYNDFAIALSFNILMERYCPGISDAHTMPQTAWANTEGLPYIVNTANGRFALVYRNVKAITNGKHRGTVQLIRKLIEPLHYASKKDILNDLKKAKVIDQGQYNCLIDRV